MAEIIWHKSGEKFFEAGIDRGVLYPKSGPGVAWNGLVNVTPNPSGGDAKPLYLDGLKYENRSLPEEFGATIEAFTYPDEFSYIMGDWTTGSGLYFGQQPQQEFGMSYRSKVGNDTVGVDKAYKIHLIYNALAQPTADPNATMGNPVDPTNFTWSITTRGIIIAGRRPTAELIVDTRTASRAEVRILERILYGEKDVSPRLPSIWEVVDIFDDWPFVQINRRPTTGLNPLSYKGLHDLKGNNRKGLYRAPSDTRLKPTSKPGLYRI